MGRHFVFTYFGYKPRTGIDQASKKDRPGTLTLQVVRSKDSVLKESKATLWIIMNEGEEDEKVQKIEVVITDKKKDALAWTLDVSGAVAETEVVKDKSLAAKGVEK